MVTAPELMARFGVGPDTAAALLLVPVTIPSDSIQRPPGLDLCGVAPIPTWVRQRAAARFVIIKVATAKPIARCGAS